MHKTTVTNLTTGETASYRGYAHGLMYVSFPGGTRHYAGMSGDGAADMFDAQTIIKGLQYAIYHHELMRSEDPWRMDEIRRFAAGIYPYGMDLYEVRYE